MTRSFAGVSLHRCAIVHVLLCTLASAKSHFFLWGKKDRGGPERDDGGGRRPIDRSLSDFIGTYIGIHLAGLLQHCLATRPTRNGIPIAIASAVVAR